MAFVFVGFTVYLRCECAVVMPMDYQVEKHHFLIDFLLTCETDSVVDGVETAVEGFGGIHLAAIAAEAGAEECARCDYSPAIIHVNS